MHQQRAQGEQALGHPGARRRIGRGQQALKRPIRTIRPYHDGPVLGGRTERQAKRAIRPTSTW
jgi:hypothetical protein